MAYEERDKEFTQKECFGIDLTIQTIRDDLDAIEKVLDAVNRERKTAD